MVVLRCVCALFPGPRCCSLSVFCHQAVVFVSPRTPYRCFRRPASGRSSPGFVHEREGDFDRVRGRGTGREEEGATRVGRRTRRVLRRRRTGADGRSFFAPVEGRCGRRSSAPPRLREYEGWGRGGGGGLRPAGWFIQVSQIQFVGFVIVVHDRPYPPWGGLRTP